jgi:thiol-disulfide isomerase/thioredoxin
MSAAPETPLTVACLCAGWCTTCQAYAAPFAQIARTLPQARFVWIDIEVHADALGDAALDIESFPTVLLLRSDAPAFFGTILPHAATLERLVRAAQDDAAMQVADATGRALAGPVASLLSSGAVQAT